MNSPYSELMADLCREIDSLNLEAHKMVLLNKDNRKIYRKLGQVDGLFWAFEMIRDLHDDYIMNQPVTS